jgi:hypothetical protein
MGGTGVEYGDGYGVGGCRKDGFEVLGKETTVEGVGTVFDEVFGL